MNLFNIDCYPDVGYMKYNKLFDCIIADPPYNNCVREEFDNQWKNNEEYLYWLEIRIRQFSNHLTRDGNLILYCKRQLEHKIKNILDKYLIEQRTIIWARKRAFNSTRGKTLSSGYEPILWYSKSNNFIFNNNNKVQPKKHLRNREEYKTGILKDGICLSDVWDDISSLPHNSKEKIKHPTQKPLKLSDRIIKYFSNEKVFIPFAGSGSEIEACILNKRKWLATEINKTYFELIKNRIK